MDAFYASVEQRDRPHLRGRPIAVGGSPEGRGVVAAASYEARRFGVRSAMSARRALQLCPQLVLVPPDFARYRAVSRQLHAILDAHSDCIEPLSLDEAYLDLTDDKAGLGSATAAAEAIRARVRAELGLTCSAGVSSLKFVAKIASDARKPDGLTVVPPSQVLAFIHPLPVRALWGVGPATARRFTQRGLHFTNLALSAFVAVAICVRFGFPAVSLEGRAFWLVLRSPIAISEFLHAKWRSMAWPLLILLNALVLFTNISLDSGWFLTLTAAIVCSFGTYGSLGLALGIGAQYPRFKIDNAAKIATGFGGLLYMGQGIALALTTTLLSIYPTLAVARWLDHGEVPNVYRAVIAVVLAVLTLGGPIWLARRALKKGATSLRKRGV